MHKNKEEDFFTLNPWKSAETLEQDTAAWHKAAKNARHSLAQKLLKVTGEVLQNSVSIYCPNYTRHKNWWLDPE